VFEELARWYLELPREGTRLLVLGLAYLGGLMVLPRESRQTARIGRSAYVALTGVFFIAVVASQAPWFLVGSPPSAGALEALVLWDLVSAVGIGCFFGIVAMRRSRDGWGHPGRFFLAYVPVVNLLLMLKPPAKEERAAHRPLTGRLRATASVAAGIFLLGLASTFSTVMDRIVDRTQHLDPVQLSANTLDL